MPISTNCPLTIPDCIWSWSHDQSHLTQPWILVEPAQCPFQDIQQCCPNTEPVQSWIASKACDWSIVQEKVMSAVWYAVHLKDFVFTARSTTIIRIEHIAKTKKKYAHIDLMTFFDGAVWAWSAHCTSSAVGEPGLLCPSVIACDLVVWGLTCGGDGTWDTCYLWRKAYYFHLLQMFFVLLRAAVFLLCCLQLQAGLF